MAYDGDKEKLEDYNVAASCEKADVDEETDDEWNFGRYHLLVVAAVECDMKMERVSDFCSPTLFADDLYFHNVKMIVVVGFGPHYFDCD